MAERARTNGAVQPDRHRSGQPYLPAAPLAPGAGTRQGLARSRRSRVRRVAGSERLRQEHAALSDRRLPAGRGRRDPGRGSPGRRSRPRSRHRVSAFRAVPVEDGDPERALRAGKAGHGARRARAAGPRIHRSRRSVGVRGQLSLATLGRHEAARRDRPHAGNRSADPADGRAVRCARCANAQPDARASCCASGSARARR